LSPSSSPFIAWPLSMLKDLHILFIWHFIKIVVYPFHFISNVLDLDAYCVALSTILRGSQGPHSQYNLYIEHKGISRRLHMVCAHVCVCEFVCVRKSVCLCVYSRVQRSTISAARRKKRKEKDCGSSITSTKILLAGLSINRRGEFS